MIKFPSDLQNQVQNQTLSCIALYGFQNPQNISCTMITSGFLIKVAGCFPSSITSVAFAIQGIINPNSERTSGSFLISSYDASGTVIEVSSSSLFTIQGTRGSILSANYSSDNQQVSQLGTLTVAFQVQDPIPYNGQISLVAPKWNPQSQMQQLSYFNVQSGQQSQQISCYGVQNIRPDIICSVAIGTTQDVLNVTYAFESEVPAGSIVIFNISEFKNPSSTASMNMISLATLDSFGYFVDYMAGGSFKVSLPDAIPVTNIAITPQDDTINAITNYQISYKIQNPAPAGSIIIVTFPPQLQLISASNGNVYLSQVTQIGRQSGSVQFQMQLQPDGSTQVTLSNAIQTYLDQGSAIFLTFSKVMNSVSLMFHLLRLHHNRHPHSQFSYGRINSTKQSRLLSTYQFQTNTYKSKQSL